MAKKVTRFRYARAGAKFYEQNDRKYRLLWEKVDGEHAKTTYGVVKRFPPMTTIEVVKI